MVTKGKITAAAERDREATEGRLVEKIGAMIRESGFEKIGVNAVAERAGVSKILIYRYFGSVDGLVAAYVRQHDFWINFPQEMPGREALPAWLKRMFRGHIAQLRADPTLRRVCRWELSSNNALIAELRAQRERTGVELVRQVSRIAGLPEAEVAAVASLVTASVTYLVMLEEFCPVYNGIAIDTDGGWEQIAQGIDRLIDRFFGE